MNKHHLEMKDSSNSVIRMSSDNKIADGAAFFAKENPTANNDIESNNHDNTETNTTMDERTNENAVVKTSSSSEQTHVTMKKEKQQSWGTSATTQSSNGDEKEGAENDDSVSESSNSNNSKDMKTSPPNSNNTSGHSRREHMFVVGVGILLSFNSGYVNGSCLSGLLTSNHISQSVAGFTGAYTISALALANGNYGIFGIQTKMILSFIFGSCISGFLTPNAVPYRIAPTYGPTFLIGGMFLTTASILSATHVEQYYFFYLAAAANGIQNGMSSLYSANLIRSTHLTGTSTDIGLFIGQCLRGNTKNLWKLGVLVSLASSFWLGGLISFFATSALTSWSLLFNAGLFLLIGIGLIVFLVREYHVSARAAVLGTWEWHNALEKLSTLSSQSQLTTSMMHVFDIVDTDHSGNICRNELYSALKTSGVQVSMRDTERMIKFADKDGDGLISRDEWRDIVSSCRSPGLL